MASAEQKTSKARPRNPKYSLGLAFTLTSATLWGSAYAVIQLSLGYYNAYTISFYRALFGTATIAIYLALAGGLKLPRRQDLGFLILGSFLGAAGFWTLLNLSVQYVQADTSSFLIAIYPLIAVVFSAVFFKERLKVITVLAVLVGLFGTFLIVEYGQHATFSGASPFLGALFAILAAFSWAGYMVTTRFLVMRKTSVQASPEYVGFYTVLFSLPITALIALITAGPGGLWNSSPLAVSYMLFMGVVCSGFAILMFNSGLKIIGIAGAAINQLLFPPVSVIVSFAVLGETVNVPEIVGMALILAAILAAQLSSRK